MAWPATSFARVMTLPHDIISARQLDLRVGKIVNAEKIPQSKRLLQLEIDSGLETLCFQGSMNIAHLIQIIGKKILVVAT